MKTLYDEEQAKKKKLKGVVFDCKGINPSKVLIKAGYKRMRKISNIDRGWKKKINSEYRYHAFITEDNNLSIHTDKNKLTKDGRQVHVASNYLWHDEKRRLKEILLKLAPQLRNEILNTKEKRKRYKTEILPSDKLKELLKQVKKINESRGKSWWERLIHFLDC